jgi:hypothetical protein
MGIANYETEIKNVNEDREHDNWLNFLEQESNVQRCFDDEMAIEAERVMRLPVMPDNLTQMQIDLIWEPKE